MCREDSDMYMEGLYICREGHVWEGVKYLQGGVIYLQGGVRYLQG